MTGNASDLWQAGNVIAQNSVMFRMAAALSDFKPEGSVPVEAPAWLQYRPTPAPPPLFDGLPQGLPVTQRGPGWIQMMQDASRVTLFEASVNEVDPQYQALLRSELPKIWAQKKSGRKWVFFHPLLKREIITKVFELNRDNPASVKRADGLVESVDNLVFGLLFVHGVSKSHWPDRRKGSKRKISVRK